MPFLLPLHYIFYRSVLGLETTEINSEFGLRKFPFLVHSALHARASIAQPMTIPLIAKQALRCA